MTATCGDGYVYLTCSREREKAHAVGTGELVHTEDITIERENPHFRRPHSYLHHLTSEHRRLSAKALYRQQTQTVGYIFAADSICASLSILKQSRLKIRASALNDSTPNTVFNTKRLLKVIQGHLFRCA